MDISGNSPQRARTAKLIDNVQDATNQLQGIQTESEQYDADIEKEFELFKHREILPQLYETIISSLPNKDNTPEQAPLYEAFARGDVAAIKKFKRNERKQIFITGISIHFSHDLEKAQFVSADMWRRSRSTLGVEGEEGEMSEYDYEMMYMQEMGGRGGG